MSKPENSVEASLCRDGFRLLGRGADQQGIWRNGGTYGKVPEALAADDSHDTEVLQKVRQALQEHGYELTSITNLVVIVRCRLSQTPHVAVIVMRALQPLGISLQFHRR